LKTLMLPAPATLPIRMSLLYAPKFAGAWVIPRASAYLTCYSTWTFIVDHERQNLDLGNASLYGITC